jgi:two-component sensor histidine kinase
MFYENVNSSMTQALPTRLGTEATAIDWPHSSVFEVHQLIANFKEMADSLTAQFQAVKQNNELLESRVQERTGALNASLEDRDALLKEVHHRVKNNLQVITSLLRLEASRSAVADTKEVLGYMRGRIRTMAQLHESLYRSGTFASVDLGAYLGQVATQAFKTQEMHCDSVRLTLNMVSVKAGMDQATAAGLLLNELISNCLKHGFPEGQTGEVSVELLPAPYQDTPPDGRWCLRVKDTGVGLPPNVEDKRKASLGLQLVTDLSNQLGGTLVIDSVSGQGARFSVVFPVQEPAPLVMPT